MKSKIKLRSGIRLLLLAGSAIIAAGQKEPAAAHAEFEVASVKPNISDTDMAYVQALPGRLLMQNFAARALILLAYGIEGYQISGGPWWIASDRYDIEAKAEGNVSVQEMEGPMLQRLLEDRFKLSFHREIRQVPGYELSVVEDGKLKPSREGSCIPYSIEAPPPPALAPGQPRPTYCGYPRYGINGQNRTLDGAGVRISDLSRALTRSELHRPVIDKTGLNATFDVHLRWTTDSLNSPDDGSESLPIFTAQRNQLGLKLISARGSVEVVVVDRLEKPSPN